MHFMLFKQHAYEFDVFICKGQTRLTTVCHNAYTLFEKNSMHAFVLFESQLLVNLLNLVRCSSLYLVRKNEQRSKPNMADRVYTSWHLVSLVHG